MKNKTYWKENNVSSFLLTRCSLQRAPPMGRHRWRLPAIKECPSVHWVWLLWLFRGTIVCSVGTSAAVIVIVMASWALLKCAVSNRLLSSQNIILQSMETIHITVKWVFCISVFSPEICILSLKKKKDNRSLNYDNGSQGVWNDIWVTLLFVFPVLS